MSSQLLTELNLKQEDMDELSTAVEAVVAVVDMAEEVT